MNPFRIYKNNNEFEEYALRLFKQQYRNVRIYREFISHLGTNPEKIRKVEDIPFLPVELFKSHKIIDESLKEKVIFTSSGTGGSLQSRHFVARPELYEESFIKNFEKNYGSPGEYCILALLPSYLERKGSSLIYMMERLIELSGNPNSGFYLYDHARLISNINRLKSGNIKILLFGVSFALLELASSFRNDLSGSIIMETGGMKGRGKEITRDELHRKLIKAFNVTNIHSEYGMTELLSQAYSKGNGKFLPAPWMKVLIRDIYDPFESLAHGKTGRIDIIDLANMDSCAFISTSDIGKLYNDGSFEVLGRIDNSDIRGCNLMIG